MATSTSKQETEEYDVIYSQSELLCRDVKELLKKHSADIDNVSGIRVVYFNRDPLSKSDHSSQHNKDWNDAIVQKGCLEGGTITQMRVEGDTPIATVCWDCGEVKTYAPDQWKYLRVYNLGPAGYLGQMVFCDKCLEPSMGLAFRLARENMSVGDLYDLCHQCYNECDDEHISNCFYCNIPSGNIDLEDSKRERPQAPRQGAQRLKVVGIFKHAIVEIEATSTGLTRGEVLNIVHEGGYQDLRKADFYESCAEVKIDATGSERLPLEYREAGSRGKVELKAIKPGEAPSTMPVEHYPTLGTEIIREMLTYKKKLIKINVGEKDECDCFMRFKDEDNCKWCYSLTISGTRLNQITDSKIWKCCKNLRIVILLMNELNDLPEELTDFSESIELVCIQHNKFTKVPPILYDLKLIKHLNLHGNQISEFPEKMKVFVELERLKFGHNKLYSLPDIFQSFQKLTEITFNDNFLTRLPPSFAGLKQLESIDLKDNSFTCIPAPLLTLLKLRVLYMEWNRIQRLAPLEDRDGEATFKFIHRLVSFKLNGNPICLQLKPRANVLKQVQDSSIFSKLHSTPIFKALRVLVLGSCGAGKTSIVEALSFDRYVTPTSEAHHDHTVGIKRFSIPVQLKTAENNDLCTELRLWDFAGERSYIMMNNLFVTDGTLVWIAVNFQTYECTDKSFDENIASWLQQVMTKAVRPVIWIIGTHTDKCTEDDTEKKVRHIRNKVQQTCAIFQDQLKNQLEKLRYEQSQYRSPTCVEWNIRKLEDLTAKNVPCFVAENLKVIHLTNTHSFLGFEDLKHHIKNLLQNPFFTHLTKPQTEKELRATDKLRQKAEELLANRDVPLLERKAVVDIIKPEFGDDSEKAAKFLEYLYQSGHLLVHTCQPESKQSERKSEVVLDVDWLIDLLAQVFHHDFPAMVEQKKVQFSFNKLDDTNIQHSVNLQQNTGIVEKELLEALWSDALPVRMFRPLLDLLETYGLAYETKKPPGSCLFPWLIAKSCPDSDPSKSRNQLKVMYYFAPCLPPCFLQQLVVKSQQHFSIDHVYTDSFNVIASKKSSLADENVTHLTVYVSQVASSGPNKMCGKIVLSACVEHDIVIDQHLSDLWKMLMTIVKEMEHLLCNWTFYGNLQRKVCCPKCLVSSWDLQIHKSNEEALMKGFACVTCSRVDPKFVIPPADCRVESYVDSYQNLLTRHSAQSAPATGASSIPETTSSKSSPQSVPVAATNHPSHESKSAPGTTSSCFVGSHGKIFPPKLQHSSYLPSSSATNNQQSSNQPTNQPSLEGDVEQPKSFQHQSGDDLLSLMEMESAPSLEPSSAATIPFYNDPIEVQQDDQNSSASMPSD